MQDQLAHNPQNLIREPALRAKLGGCSHSHIWRLVKDGELPKPIRIGRRAVAWVEAEVDALIEAKRKQRAA